MSNYSKPLAAKLSRDERGQMAVVMVMVLPVVFLFFAMALDAGLWFFDHRLAQNQADAAALAASQHLPVVENSLAHDDAKTAVDTWVIKNGSDPAELDCGDGSPSPEFRDIHPTSNPDGRLDWVRVCVRRESPGIFSGLAGLNFIYVSAAATVRVGPVGSIANVMPWGLVPPDTGCTAVPQVECNTLDQLGNTVPCGYFPPVPAGERLCPWGLDEDKLYVFKVGSGPDDEVYTPGNFGAISACGNGVNEYKDCIQGQLATGFFAEGETVNIKTSTGVFGGNTGAALGSCTPAADPGRYCDEADDFLCDIPARPDPLTGLDPRGKARAVATFVQERSAWTDPDTSIVYDFETGCDFRLVSIPVLQAFPDTGASEDILVLGVSTFAITGWDRTNPSGDDLGDQTRECQKPPAGAPPPPGQYYQCGMVWGYLIADAFPPNTLVNSISDTANPFAPLLIAMVE